MKKKVLIGPSTFAKLDTAPKNKLVNAGFEVVDNPFGRKLTKQELFDLLPGIDGLIAGLEPLDREVLERSSLKVISRCGSGLSNVDLSAARELGIGVYSTPQAPVTAVAELTVGALISLIRKLPQVDWAMHERKWEKYIGGQLEGKQATIIGFGRIGRKVAQLLKAFGVEIVAVDPAYSGVVDGISMVSLEEALRNSEIILLHCLGNSQILGDAQFKQMKKGSYLLNAARGELIDEQALIAALENGILAGAWLDVFKEEPYAGPLCGYSQVVLTPHIGSYTQECRSSMELEAVNNLLKAFK